MESLRLLRLARQDEAFSRKRARQRARNALLGNHMLKT